MTQGIKIRLFENTFSLFDIYCRQDKSHLIDTKYELHYCLYCWYYLMFALYFSISYQYMHQPFLYTEYSVIAVRRKAVEIEMALHDNIRFNSNVMSLIRGVKILSTHKHWLAYFEYASLRSCSEIVTIETQQLTRARENSHPPLLKRHDLWATFDGLDSL